MAIAVASLGGIKLNNTLKEKEKTNRYNKLSENFRKKRTDILLEQDFPNWDDHIRWGKLHSYYLNNKKIYGDMGGEKWFPNVESLKKYCFQEANKDKDLTGCNPSQGWCDPCLITVPKV